ncbi:hypothetical protein BIW11_05051 [Tropilaelaps mercedesae]|uniref:Uncharacterized protein n=1 Tax=Tropilaelaps mercedesae TaxID=418985 RepID=A0A1V9WY88_9ACAR|nr:hypothetical protein BIW11_05051 [Tropilaelaps mercedesae]
MHVYIERNESSGSLRIGLPTYTACFELEACGLNAGSMSATGGRDHPNWPRKKPRPMDGRIRSLAPSFLATRRLRRQQCYAQQQHDGNLSEERGRMGSKDIQPVDKRVYLLTHGVATAHARANHCLYTNWLFRNASPCPSTPLTAGQPSPTATTNGRKARSWPARSSQMNTTTPKSRGLHLWTSAERDIAGRRHLNAENA